MKLALAEISFVPAILNLIDEITVYNCIAKLEIVRPTRAALTNLQKVKALELYNSVDNMVNGVARMSFEDVIAKLHDAYPLPGPEYD